MVKEINKEQEESEFKDFPIDIKRDIVDILNDTPSLVTLGDKEYRVKNMRYYSLYRISSLVLNMRKNDESLDTDQKIIMALCTDLDAMCEIMAVVLCNHLFTPDDIHGFDDVDSVMSRNDKLVQVMKAKVMNSTFDTNQLAAIILGAIKSIDLSLIKASTGISFIFAIKFLWLCLTGIKLLGQVGVYLMKGLAKGAPDLLAYPIA